LIIQIHKSSSEQKLNEYNTKQSKDSIRKIPQGMRDEGVKVYV